MNKKIKKIIKKKKTKNLIWDLFSISKVLERALVKVVIPTDRYACVLINLIIYKLGRSIKICVFSFCFIFSNSFFYFWRPNKICLKRICEYRI